VNIKQAYNTHILANKIIGNSTFSQNSTSSIQNQSIIIDSDTSLYLNDSPINITNAEISYSNLGLLNPPTISVSTSKNTLNSYISTSKTTMHSILNENIELKKIYDNIIFSINNSINSKDYILKETYLLLSLQSLSNFIISTCNTFLTNSTLNSYKNTTDVIYIIKELFNSSFCISKSIKMLNTLIGQSEISLDYSQKIINELSSALVYLESNITNLINNDAIPISQDSLELINSLIKKSKDLLIIDENSNILFAPFKDCILNLLESINLINNQLKLLESQIPKNLLLNLTFSLENIIKSAQSAVLCISLSYSNITNNYNTIINNLKSACNYIKMISPISNHPNLSTSFSSNIFLTKSFSKDITNTNINNQSEKTTNYNNSIITENITLSLSFYVYNLQINIRGTIGDNSFTGHILYSGLYNLSFFGINDIIVNTDISIPSSTNYFNISQYINPVLEVTNIKTDSTYNVSTQSTFYCNIDFTLFVKVDTLATAPVPLIITK